ncbi:MULTISPECIES: acyl carrier protein [Streptomyces]|uniref:Acyl carrier protein n=1 Tax=Streptomyces ehimensis TaxID=68195 RepID=A0ABV9BTL8_9ACTN
METAYDLMTRLLTDHFGVPGERIAPDATFEELGIGSVARVEPPAQAAAPVRPGR